MSQPISPKSKSRQGQPAIPKQMHFVVSLNGGKTNASQVEELMARAGQIIRDRVMESLGLSTVSHRGSEAHSPDEAVLELQRLSEILAESPKEIADRLKLDTIRVQTDDAGEFVVSVLDGAARIQELTVAVDHAMELFGGKVEAVRRWFHEPIRALGQVSPWEVVARPGGCGTVDDVLGRIEHGVYS